MENLPIMQKFDQCRKISTKSGREYWTARELQPNLGYKTWEAFAKVIEDAMAGYAATGGNPSDHIRPTSKMIIAGKGATRPVDDYHMTREGAYLIAMNGSSTIPEIAAAQNYFASQTVFAEQIQKELKGEHDEDGLRLELRSKISDHNKALASSAKGAGVETPFDFAIFQDEGYKGLYGGKGQKELHAARSLLKSAKILDHMGSTELAANLFRATQAEEKLRADGITNKADANKTHREVGRKVREAMRGISGVLPEDLPVAPSIKKLETAKKKTLRNPKPN